MNVTVNTAMVTPLDERGELNLDLVAPYLEFQRAAGIDGVVVCGTNGEGPSLGVDERKRLLEAVIAHRGTLAVIAGVGASNLPETLDLTAHAAALGADAALVLPPFYFKAPPLAGLVAYFRRVLEAAGLPVLLYSIPQQSAVPITTDLLDALAGHPQLLGLKDSEGDLDRITGLLSRFPSLSVYSGGDQILGPALDAGVAGAISGTANAVPGLVAAVRAAGAGKRDLPQSRLDRAKDILLEYPLIAGNKAVLAALGIGPMRVRPPLVDLTDSQARELVSRLKAEGLL